MKQARARRVTPAILRSQSVDWLAARIKDDQRIIDLAAVTCELCGRKGAPSQFESFPISLEDVQIEGMRCVSIDHCETRSARFESSNDLFDPETMGKSYQDDGSLMEAEEPDLPYATAMQVERSRRTMLMCLAEMRRRGLVDEALRDARLMK